MMWAVIPAGGSGTRLWPASRRNRPKFLLPLPGPQSMLQATWERLRPLVAPQHCFVVTGATHAAAVREQLCELPAERVIAEPVPRGTGPAIGLAAFLVARHAPQALMGSFAADHFVAEPEAFRRAVRAGLRAASEGYLVTIGVPARYPETGYGYIRIGEPLFTAEDLTVHRVSQFKEKPDRKTAEAYVRSGEYCWNASMFLWRVDVFLEALRELLPDVHAPLAAIAACWGTPEGQRCLEELWPTVPEVTIDHGIMERASEVAVVPAEFGWADLGDWHGLAELLADDADDSVVLGCEHLGLDTRATLIYGGRRLVVTLGVEDLVVVDTDDVLLVAHRSRAQEVREIVRQLEQLGRHDLL
ncbi:mannose-1-phosphate guanylyltransferase [Thermomicrobium sp. CFH 73360]|uniref:mannose-1-phosphate guanylyltransferase n=1 Tax=Thermomicrobium sp. CFH 73360 TaxID=2951987 RepID=UPI00207711B7|nr:mannose-1-phosphate guanylyltransferase [Thermomicrobium sp. CFH 73360]MCM8746038.1 mannose-1-phosphate guanylyltransferase [Thermomicrobium sp. CFH 73360]